MHYTAVMGPTGSLGIPPPVAPCPEPDLKQSKSPQAGNTLTPHTACHVHV